jgi:CHAT domain-containing protein
MAAKTGLRNEPLFALGGAVYSTDHVSEDRGTRAINLAKAQAVTTSRADQEREEQRRTETLVNAKSPAEYYRIYNGGASWPDIDGTNAEVEQLRALARGRFLTGAEVTEKQLKDMSGTGELKTYPILHFACHGVFNEHVPGWSSIVFSEVSGLDTGEDGYLTVEEIALLDLDARIAVLSACETGLGQVKRGDGMVGLTRSFLIAGVENVGVSLWSISDEASVEFMVRVYHKVLNQGLAFKEAYYQVKNEFRTHEKWSHPLYWAAFTIYE